VPVKLEEVQTGPKDLHEVRQVRMIRHLRIRQTRKTLLADPNHTFEGQLQQCDGLVEPFGCGFERIQNLVRPISADVALLDRAACLCALPDARCYMRHAQYDEQASSAGWYFGPNSGIMRAIRASICFFRTSLLTLKRASKSLFP